MNNIVTQKMLDIMETHTWHIVALWLAWLVLLAIVLFK